MKECPMCGELMRLDDREAAEQLPGRTEPLVRHVREWICPECDYFEDAEAGEG
jgi:acetone carboxylase gamma subunit